MTASDDLLPPSVREEGSDEQLAALYTALAEAQGEFEQPKRSAAVDFRTKKGERVKFQYAPLHELIRCYRPALSKRGLCWLTPVVSVGGRCRVVGILAHAQGGRLVAEMGVPRADGIKELGAHITYIRRYLTNAMLGLDGDPDADDVPTSITDEKEAAVSRKPAQKVNPEHQAPTDDQRETIRYLMRRLGYSWSDLADRFRVIVGRDVDDPRKLTRADVARLIDLLAAETRRDEPRKMVEGEDA